MFTEGFPVLVTFCDLDAAFCKAIRFELLDYVERGSVEVVNTDILGDYVLDLGPSGWVSPANSFGFMDGGLDLAYSRKWPRSESLVRDEIKSGWHGELPVGSCLGVKLPMDGVPYRWLLVSPTMRVPGDVSGSINAYLSMRAVLRHSLFRYRFGNIGGGSPYYFDSVVCPGLCTGVGKMAARESARQMAMAYRSIVEREYVSSLGEAMMDHGRLLGIGGR